MRDVCPLSARMVRSGLSASGCIARVIVVVVQIVRVFGLWPSPPLSLSVL